MSAPIHGMVGEFYEANQLLQAVKHAREEGYHQLDAYAPFAVEGLNEALGRRRTRVPVATLVGGIIGGVTAYGLQSYSAAIDYPLNVGGRPLHSWPAFVPITFELTVLFAALSTVLAMLYFNGLPRLHHPIFNTPNWEANSHSRFYLCVGADDPNFELEKVRTFLARENPAAIWEVDKT